MKLYVYQSLVNDSEIPIKKINVTLNNLKATFNASRMSALIACANKKDALLIMGALIKEHNVHILKGSI